MRNICPIDSRARPLLLHGIAWKTLRERIGQMLTATGTMAILSSMTPVCSVPTSDDEGRYLEMLVSRRNESSHPMTETCTAEWESKRRLTSRSSELLALVSSSTELRESYNWPTRLWSDLHWMVHVKDWRAHITGSSDINQGQNSFSSHHNERRSHRCKCTIPNFMTRWSMNQRSTISIVKKHFCWRSGWS